MIKLSKRLLVLATVILSSVIVAGCTTLPTMNACSPLYLSGKSVLTRGDMQNITLQNENLIKK